MKYSIRLTFAGLLAALVLSACGEDMRPPAPLVAPTGVAATGRDRNNLVSWTSSSAVSGVTSYNVYWSTTPGVSKTNGTCYVYDRY